MLSAGAVAFALATIMIYWVATGHMGSAIFSTQSTAPGGPGTSSDTHFPVAPAMSVAERGEGASPAAAGRPVEEDGSNDITAAAGLELLSEYTSKPADNILFEAALAQSTRGDDSAAMKSFAGLAETEPHNALWPLGMGMVASRSLQRVTAERHFVTAVQIAQQYQSHPQFVERWVAYYRALNLLRPKTMEQAIRQLEKLSTDNEPDVATSARQLLQNIRPKSGKPQ
jgi:hypothetical protein